MLFHTAIYAFCFLPVVFLGYFLLNRRRLTIPATAFLGCASLFFYGWWNWRYVPLLLASILVNWRMGEAIVRAEAGGRRAGRLLALGITLDLALLGYFKYTDFFIGNLDRMGASLPLMHIVLPLGISFFTFTQIAYLVDARRGLAHERRFLNYLLFVTWFPHLIAGPIIHHKEMMPQFADLRKKAIRYRNVTAGMFLFTIGVVKKVAFADTFSHWAIAGFDGGQTLTLAEGWVTSLAYTLQLYFDFSGYTDMALGASLLFNVRLPFNFNSPYQAVSIQDFWRRWHMTLSRFLRDYLYIPLGGNKKGEGRTYLNLILTFVLGGLWHGAAWTFVVWGALHGAASAVHRWWSRSGRALPVALAVTITFLFVNAAWVFFRAKTWDDAVRVLSAMGGMGAEHPLSLAHIPQGGAAAMAIFAGLLLVMRAPNSNDLTRRMKASPLVAAGMGLALGSVIIYTVIASNRVSEFIYYGF